MTDNDENNLKIEIKVRNVTQDSGVLSKEISADQSFPGDNNTILFVIEESSAGEKYCTLEYS